MNLINTRRFGASCNNSFIPFQAALRGKTHWEEAAPASTRGQGATILAMKGNLLFALYPSGVINCRDRNTGRLLWDREVREGAEFELTPAGILTMGAGSVYALIDDSGKSIDQQRIPFAGNGRLWALWQVNKEYRYCYALAPRQTAGPEEPVHGPAWSYVRYAPGAHEEFLWELSRSGFIRDAFLSADKSKLCVISDNTICLITTDGTGDADVRTIACEEAFCGSFDAKGNLLAVLTETVKRQRQTFHRTSLACFNRDGKHVWSLELPNSPRCPQPPASIDDGAVYALCGNELLLVENGQKTWGIDLPCEWNRAFFTVLKDQSAMVCAGAFLLHINRSGNETARVALPEPLTCRPIVDELGRTYVAGKAKVYCVE